jgi:hypothetical protein
MGQTVTKNSNDVNKHTPKHIESSTAQMHHRKPRVATHLEAPLFSSTTSPHMHCSTTPPRGKWQAHTHITKSFIDNNIVAVHPEQACANSVRQSVHDQLSATRAPRFPIPTTANNTAQHSTAQHSTAFQCTQPSRLCFASVGNKSPVEEGNMARAKRYMLRHLSQCKEECKIHRMCWDAIANIICYKPLDQITRAL